MIVTFDTSILVRATKRSTGPARRVIDALATHPDHVIALSPFILAEVGKVLSYPRMQELFGLSADEIQVHLDYLSSISRIVEPRIGLLGRPPGPQRRCGCLHRDRRWRRRAVRKGSTFLWCKRRGFLLA